MSVPRRFRYAWIEYLRFAVPIPLTFQVRMEYVSSVVLGLIMAGDVFNRKCSVMKIAPGIERMPPQASKQGNRTAGRDKENTYSVNNKSRVHNYAGRSANGRPSKLGKIERRSFCGGFEPVGCSQHNAHE